MLVAEKQERAVAEQAGATWAVAKRAAGLVKELKEDLWEESEQVTMRESEQARMPGSELETALSLE